MEPITISALGTTWWVEVFDTLSNQRRDELTKSITTLLLSIESRFSRFCNESLVGTLNATRRVHTNDPDLAELITLGRDMYRRTRGAFNILIGDALIARGYDQAYSLTTHERPVNIGNPLTDLTYTKGTWDLAAGILDLGGIGKGWAIDQIAEQLYSDGITEFLINGGGDMFGTTEQGRPITIFLEHPTAPETFLGTVTIMNQGFAASSPHKRRWRIKTGEVSHIVHECNDIDASFIIAPSAVTADLLATTALLLPALEFHTLAADMGATYATYTLRNSRLEASAHFPFNTL